LHFDTASGRIAGLDEFMTMTAVGLVVAINSEDFNVASVFSTVDRQNNAAFGSIQTSADHLVLGQGRDTSSFHVDSEGQHGWKVPATVDHSSQGRVGEGVHAEQVREILGRISFGISRSSLEESTRSNESSGLTAKSINTNNGDGILSVSRQIEDVDFREESGIRSWISGGVRGDCDDP